MEKSIARNKNGFVPITAADFERWRLCFYRAPHDTLIAGEKEFLISRYGFVPTRYAPDHGVISRGLPIFYFAETPMQRRFKKLGKYLEREFDV